jgi:protease YdgD
VSVKSNYTKIEGHMKKTFPRFNLLLAIALPFLTLQGCGENAHTSKIGAIFGQDDRVPMRNGNYPWGSIGKLETTAGNCTATLIARDLIVTAAHCITDGGRINTGPATFYAHLVNNQFAAQSPVTQIWTGSLNPEEASRVHDWALLRLRDPLGERFDTISIKNTTVEDFPATISLAGFSHEFQNAETAAIHFNCSVRRRHTVGIIFHDCDSTAGSSGGPMIGYINGTYYIAGIHVATYSSSEEQVPDYSDALANVAIPSNEFLRKAHELLGN